MYISFSGLLWLVRRRALSLPFLINRFIHNYDQLFLKAMFVLQQAIEVQREGGKRYSCTFSLTSALDGVDG
jgi:hypothetical protein